MSYKPVNAITPFVLVADVSPFRKPEETLIFGRCTKEWIKADRPELSERRLSYVGITDAHTPYEVIRPCFLDGHIIATLEGEGELWYGGQWRRLTAGDIFINPPSSPEAFRAVPKRKWLFCWAHARPKFFETYDSRKAQVFQADPRPFHLALQGYLNHEPANSPPKTLELWANLLTTHIFDLMQSGKRRARLWKIWEAVIKNPGQEWNIEKLCRISGLSREQLRYHSLLETGHSPMHHVAYLRVQRAIALLQTSDSTLETISELVGYSNPFALSNAILKITGNRPSSYRHFCSRNLE